MAPKKAFVEPPVPEPEPEEDMELEEDEEDEEDEDYEGMMDPSAMLAPFLSTEEGDNVCTALVTMGEHMDKMNKLIETQNKILVKLLSHFTKGA